MCYPFYELLASTANTVSRIFTYMFTGDIVSCNFLATTALDFSISTCLSYLVPKCSDSSILSKNFYKTGKIISSLNGRIYQQIKQSTVLTSLTDTGIVRFYLLLCWTGKVLFFQRTGLFHPRCQTY